MQTNSTYSTASNVALDIGNRNVPNCFGSWPVRLEEFAYEGKHGCADSHRNHRRLRAGISFAFCNQLGSLRRGHKIESSTGTTLAAYTVAGGTGSGKDSAALGRADCFAGEPLQKPCRDVA